MTDDSLKNEIIRILIYNEVFHHPVKPDEVLPAFHDHYTVRKNIDELISLGMVREERGYLYIFTEEGKIARRESGNQRAVSALPRARRIAKFIYRFPFVEGVGISGSLSKGVLDEEGDFDYFVITRPNRLWIARTILIAYKKIVLLNSRRHFCLNYFIDSDHLTIEDQNLFTATEVATLIPVCGNVFYSFQDKNNWIFAYGKAFRPLNKTLFVSGKRLPARFVQGLLGRSFGEWVDKRCMRVTMKHWKRKFSFFTDEKFDLALKSRTYVSKHHPNDFQSKVLNKYQELHEQYVLQYGLQSLTEETAS